MITNNIKISSIFLILLAFTFTFIFPSVQAQDITYFTSEDTFSIPESNGSVRFAVNGSCSEISLVDNTWIFNNLSLNGSFPLGSLKFSAKDSDVTIYSFYSGDYFARRLGFLRYFVEGEGIQEINLGFNSSERSDPSEWSVILPGSIFLAEGAEWRLLSDDTVVIIGQTGNISVARYNYGLEADNNPFYVQHSIAILTGIAVAATVGFCVIIKVRIKTEVKMN